MAKCHSRSVRPLPRLLDIAGVSEHLAVSERHVRRLVAEERIPYIKWDICCASILTSSPSGSTPAAGVPPDQRPARLAGAWLRPPARRIAPA